MLIELENDALHSWPGALVDVNRLVSLGTDRLTARQVQPGHSSLERGHSHLTGRSRSDISKNQNAIGRQGFFGYSDPRWWGPLT